MNRTAIALFGTVGLAACAMPAVPPAPVSIAAVEAAGDALPAAIALGDFRPGPDLAPGTDRGVGIRAAVIKPQGGTFSGYLRETLRNQLVSAGRYDEHAPVRLDGLILRSEAGSGVGEQSGHGVLVVRFVLRHGDSQIYAHDYLAEHRWSSSFIGAVAYSEAESGYMSLYPEVITAMFKDPDLRAALRKAPVSPGG